MVGWTSVNKRIPPPVFHQTFVSLLISPQDKSTQDTQNDRIHGREVIGSKLRPAREHPPRQVANAMEIRL
jgi:hypothetical protein